MNLKPVVVANRGRIRGGGEGYRTIDAILMELPMFSRNSTELVVKLE